ncbi:MAG: hypothetical protein H8E14_04360 [Candidatus Marinimicrobia bacterium]|nr:hypothetical protein [Candidatus Neomarinimicrobiota bacterium]
MDLDLIMKHQMMVGNTSIGSSTARGMGLAGTIKSVREFLGAMDLKRFNVGTMQAFEKELEVVTNELKSSLASGARYWGSSRKFLNIFLRNVQYNRYLWKYYNLDKLEKWLELPLDSHVAKGLKNDGGKHLPRWISVIGLEKPKSDLFQSYAKTVAARRGIERVHLDLYYWRGMHKECVPKKA